jgi:hypothetical protein
MDNELTQIEKELIMDFIACAYCEGYKGGRQLYTINLDLEKTIKSIGKKLGFYEGEVNMIFE